MAEARRNAQSLDYNLTIVELFLPDDGEKGDGAMVAGAEVKVDDETRELKITAFQATPTKLLNVSTK